MKRKSFLLSIVGGAASFLAGCKRGTPPAKAASPSRAGQLTERLFDDTTATVAVAAAYIGDRLGLFKAMAAAGPMTADQLARKTGLNQRYVLEWLRVMASSNYIDYHPGSGTFEMPPENAAILADEDSPLFLGGLIEGTVPDVLMVQRVMNAFRNGAGIPYADYPVEVFEAMERLSKPEYRYLLAQQWIPAVDGAAERLRAGGSTADLGCGGGLASIAIAQAFPQARAAGFEPYEPEVIRARQNARAAGVADRVKFETFDGVQVPGGPYDLITINYSLHHAGDPVALMRSARGTLAPGGAFLIIECRKSARLEEDINTPRRWWYPYGLLECMPTALAENGPGYGAGIPEPEVRRLAQRSGFRGFTRVLPEDPMRSFFVLRA